MPFYGLALLLAMGMLLMGCNANSPDNPPSDAPVRVIVVPVKTHWEKSTDKGCCMTYERCVDNTSRRIIIQTMHATGKPSDPFGVYEHGAAYGEYTTADAAKKAAIARHPECAEEGRP